MITLEKKKGKDFVVLHITDTQVGDVECVDGNMHYETMKYTVNELVKRVKPDLITVGGDISYAGQTYAYEVFAKFMDTFQIPWSVVWGNHDNQGGEEFIDEMEKVLAQSRYFIYESGDHALGRGNFVIGIQQDNSIVEGIIMVDTHNVFEYDNGEGGTFKGYASWTDAQKEWYRKEIARLKELGCSDTTIISHIPITAYDEAYKAASNGVKHQLLEESYGESYWKDGYKDSFGVKYEDCGCAPRDDGVLEILSELGSTKNYIAGHEHVNNYSILYKGVRLTYGTKTGSGCYWNMCLNGGTVLLIGDEGVKEVYHESVPCFKVERNRLVKLF